MDRSKLLAMGAIVLVIALFVGIRLSQEQRWSSAPAATAPTDEHAGHDHAGHDHTGDEHTGATAEKSGGAPAANDKMDNDKAGSVEVDNDKVDNDKAGNDKAGSVGADNGKLVKKDLKVGTGAEAKTGQMVTVHYRGTLTNGTKFDASYDRGEPFTFTLDAGEVIKGWDQGVVGMKVGGRRKLIIPSELAYGESAKGDVIPPNATLVFEIELLKVE